MPSHFLLKLVLRDVTTWSLAQESGFVLPFFISFTLLFFFIFYMLVSKLSGLRHMMIKILRSLNYQYFCSGHRHISWYVQYIQLNNCCMYSFDNLAPAFLKEACTVAEFPKCLLLFTCPVDILLFHLTICGHT